MIMESFLEINNIIVIARAALFRPKQSPSSCWRLPRSLGLDTSPSATLDQRSLAMTGGNKLWNLESYN